MSRFGYSCGCCRLFLDIVVKVLSFVFCFRCRQGAIVRFLFIVVAKVLSFVFRLPSPLRLLLLFSFLDIVVVKLSAVPVLTLLGWFYASHLYLSPRWPITNPYSSLLFVQVFAVYRRRQGFKVSSFFTRTFVSTFDLLTNVIDLCCVCRCCVFGELR